MGLGLPYQLSWAIDGSAKDAGAPWLGLVQLCLPSGHTSLSSPRESERGATPSVSFHPLEILSGASGSCFLTWACLLGLHIIGEGLYLSDRASDLHEGGPRSSISPGRTGGHPWLKPWRLQPGGIDSTQLGEPVVWLRHPLCSWVSDLLSCCTSYSYNFSPAPLLFLHFHWLG